MERAYKMEKHKVDLINKAIDHLENESSDPDSDEEEPEEVQTTLKEVQYL